MVTDDFCSELKRNEGTHAHDIPLLSSPIRLPVLRRRITNLEYENFWCALLPTVLSFGEQDFAAREIHQSYLGVLQRRCAIHGFSRVFGRALRGLEFDMCDIDRV